MAAFLRNLVGARRQVRRADTAPDTAPEPAPDTAPDTAPERVPPPRSEPDPVESPVPDTPRCPVAHVVSAPTLRQEIPPGVRPDPAALDPVPIDPAPLDPAALAGRQVDARPIEPTPIDPASIDVLEPADPAEVDPAEACAFLEQYHAESVTPVPDQVRRQRLAAVRAEIDATGTYRHTRAELIFGARVAWRNASRCIGRLYWQSLRVRDRRQVSSPAEMAMECVEHLREATRGGRIRSTLTVFAPDVPGRPGPRILNEQLIRYAGHRKADGTITGDPRYTEFTDLARSLGWRPEGEPGRFDVLPLLVSGQAGAEPRMFRLPPDAVLEVPLRHPEYTWFSELGLRWHAVPAISSMPLDIGGVRYGAAPFNGWYLSTEIGARNLADTDRYDLLPEIADRLWLNTSSERTLWRDRALVELMRAVQYSFDEAGVQMSDHHTESRRFLEHVAREKDAGRRCPADWSWIVPPMSGALTPVFHRYYDEPDPGLRPAFLAPDTALPPATQTRPVPRQASLG